MAKVYTNCPVEYTASILSNKWKCLILRDLIDGTEKYGEKAYPRPVAVIMQYTGLTEVTGEEPPTYSCVGTRDGIASYQTMQERINRIKENGTDAEIEVFEGLPHGFGLGEGAVAERWIDNAVAFWERNVK